MGPPTDNRPWGAPRRQRSSLRPSPNTWLSFFLSRKERAQEKQVQNSATGVRKAWGWDKAGRKRCVGWLRLAHWAWVRAPTLLLPCSGHCLWGWLREAEQVVEDPEKGRGGGSQTPSLPATKSLVCVSMRTWPYWLALCQQLLTFPRAILPFPGLLGNPGGRGSSGTWYRGP